MSDIIVTGPLAVRQSLRAHLMSQVRLMVFTRILSASISFCDNRVLPRLTYVCSNGLHIGWNAIQMSNLYVLYMRRVPIGRCPSIYDFRDLLRGCPQLSKITLDAASPRWIYTDVVDISLPPIDLPCLAAL